MTVRDDRGDVKQTTTGFRGPLMVQSLTSAKSKFLSLEVLLDLLRESKHAPTSSELRTRLRARRIRLTDYEVIRLLRDLRNEGLVSLDRRRWSAHKALPKVTPDSSPLDGEPPTVSVPIPGRPLPQLDQDWTPRKSWIFEGSTASVEQPTVEHIDNELFTGPWGTFRRLLGYYTDCVRKDGGCEASANIPDLGNKFTVIQSAGSWYPRAGQKWRYTLPASEHLQGLFQTLTSSGEAGALILGYPIWIYLDSDTAENDPFMKPIFTYQLDYELIENGVRIWSDDPLPDINYDWLRYSLKTPEQQRSFLTVAGLMRRVSDEEAADDGSGTNLRPDFSALGNAVMTFFGTQVRQPLNPESLSRLSSTDRPQTGIYNHAVIMAANRTRYTQSLLKDLSRIQKSPDEELDSTALKRVFRESSDITKENDQTLEEKDKKTPQDPASVVVDNLELNSEQRDAVASLITNDITVVTGPPGTGKSQVVVSAVANARLRNQKVLFASRNHKAIDSVVLRPEMMTTDEVPIIVRANNKANDISFNFSNAIGQLLTAPHDASAAERAELLKQQTRDHLKTRGELTVKANIAVDLREKIAYIEEELSRLSDDWSEGEIQALDNCSEIFPSEEVIQLEKSLARLPRFKEPLRFWQHVLLWFLSRPVWRLTGKINRRLDKKIPDWSERLPGKGVSELLYLNERTPKLRAAATYCRGRIEQKPLETLASEATAVEDLFAGVERETKEITSLGGRALSSDTAARVGFPPDEDRESMASLRTALSNYSNPLLDDGIRQQTYQALTQNLPKLLWHYPAWAVTNLSIASRIPLVPGMFDIAIIDEASQCDIPSAIPILFRAKRAGVVGDRYQLSHTTNLSRSRDNMICRAHKIVSLREQRFSYIDTSLFDLFAETNGVNPIWLLDHYRCAFGIAEYANQTFYGSRLRIVTAADRLRIPAGQEPGIHWSEINSTIEGRTNGCVAPEEAEQIATSLRKLLVDDQFEGTVGVVTPFQQQKQLIYQCISLDPEIVNAGVRANLIVDTAHGFQADERDVMFMSLCGGPDMPAGSLAFLRKTANLLNVAATRARAVLHIIGNKTWAVQCGISHISALTRPPRARPEVNSPIDNRFESPWERKLYHALVERGLNPIPQYPLLGRRLDFALIAEGKDPIDLEVDGARFHLEPDGSRRRDDIWRDITVRGAGWTVMRFWVHDLRDRMDHCVDQIEKKWGA